MEPKILVLDGNQRASLAAVRALGTKGLWVAVGTTSKNSLAGSSRFCKSETTYSDPSENPRLFFEDILNSIKRLDISFVIPITEISAYVLLKFRDELPADVTLPFPDASGVDQLANKNQLVRIAQEEGLAVPDTRVCNSPAEGVDLLHAIDKFPVVLKPFKSKILEQDKIISTRVIVAQSREEAISEIRKNDFFQYPFSIQSFIEGTGQGIFALFDHGAPVCYFSHRRLREKPPAGGVSVLCESAPVNEILKNAAERLLSRAQWHGVAMVEFRVAEDGTGYLMEVNPRFWGSLQLAVDSGINFPWLLYLVSTGRPIPESQCEYRRVRWLLGDLDRLYLVLKAPLTTYSISHKLLETLRFLKPNLKTKHEINRWRDPLPFWIELKQYLRGLRS